MTFCTRAFTAATVMVPILMACSGGDTISPAPQPDAAASPLEALSDAIKQDRSDLGAPGVAFAVLQGDEVTFSEGFGEKTRWVVDADAGTSNDVQATTLFRMGSLTKMLTATGVLRLVQAGALDLDAPVVDYVPDLNLGSGDPEWVASITLRHLLSHTSGIADQSSCCWGDDSRTEETYWTEDTANSSATLKQLAPAGRLWNYSNSGYSLAALVIERLSGRAFTDYMREEVFLPLGMTRTFFTPEDVLNDGDFAYGQCGPPACWATTEGVGPGDVEPEAAYGAAFAWSSVLDLAAFAHFLMNGDESVLRSSLREELTREQAVPRWDFDVANLGGFEYLLEGRPVSVGTRYGFGVFTQNGTYLRDPGTFHEIALWSHTGDTKGFGGNIIMVPSSRTAFISLSNLSGISGGTFGRSHAHALEHFADLPEPTPAPYPSIDPATFTKYAGDYVDLQSPQWTLSVREEAGRLTLSTTDPAAVIDRDLVPLFPDYFGFTREGEWLGELTFFPGDDGNIEFLRVGRSVAVPYVR